MNDERDFMDDWTPAMWRQALRSTEDAVATNFKTVLRLADALDTLADLYEVAVKRKGNEAANAARKIAADARAQQVVGLGLSIAATAAKLRMDKGQVSRYRRRLRKS